MNEDGRASMGVSLPRSPSHPCEIHREWNELRPFPRTQAHNMNECRCINSQIVRASHKIPEIEIARAKNAFEPNRKVK